MALNSESFNKDLYDLLKVRGYDPVPLNSKNQRVNVSQDADVFQFDFKKDGENYGKAWVTVDDAHSVIVYYNEEQQDSPSTVTPGVEYDDTWTGFCKVLKSWAQRRQLGFELKNASYVGDDMRQRDYYRMKEKLGESYHAMGKKASYNDAVPNVKIILQHNRSLEEGEQRYRNVARIFLENQDGERFLAPTTRPGLARVYARHIAEGGVPNDERWNHIKGMCEDYNKMAGFVRATRNKQFNESAQSLVNEGLNHYSNLRETLQKLTGHRGYHAYFENYTPALMEGDGEDISEMFMSSSMDPRIESALPIISRLQKKVNEMEEVSVLDEWAGSVIGENLELDEDSEDKLEQLQTLAKINTDPAVEKVINAKLAQFSKKKELSELSTGKKWDYTAFGSENVNKLLDKIPGSDPDEANKLLNKATKRNQNIKKVTKQLTQPLEEQGAWAQMSQQKYKMYVTNPKDPYEKYIEVDATSADEAKKLVGEKLKLTPYEYKQLDVQMKKPGTGTVSVLQTDPEQPNQPGQQRDTEYGSGPYSVAQARKDAESELASGKSKGGFLSSLAKHYLDVDIEEATDLKSIPEDDLEEDLGPEQKRVGQLGPYEKVGPKGAVGKLVGASESVEHDELTRLIDIARFK